MQWQAKRALQIITVEVLKEQYVEARQAKSQWGRRAIKKKKKKLIVRFSEGVLGKSAKGIFAGISSEMPSGMPGVPKRSSLKKYLEEFMKEYLEKFLEKSVEVFLDVSLEESLEEFKARHNQQ